MGGNMFPRKIERNYYFLSHKFCRGRGGGGGMAAVQKGWDGKQLYKTIALTKKNYIGHICQNYM